MNNSRTEYEKEKAVKPRDYTVGDYEYFSADYVEWLEKKLEAATGKIYRTIRADVWDHGEWICKVWGLDGQL